MRKKVMAGLFGGLLAFGLAAGDVQQVAELTFDTATKQGMDSFPISTIGNARQDQDLKAKGRTGLVYVMSNQETGNSVTVFHRAVNGALSRKGTFPTGGIGIGRGHDLEDASDAMVSQGALIMSVDRLFLFGVDTGSSEISVMGIDGEKLVLVDRVPSGGTRPVSLTAYGNLLYVANAGGPPPNANGPAATIAGFIVARNGKLTPIKDSVRALPSGPTAAPSQVYFSPDGAHLLVTERQANGIVVYPIAANGRPGAPVRTQSSGPAPFTVTFHGRDIVVSTEVVGADFTFGAVSTYKLAKDGKLTPITKSLNTHELAACWTVESILDPSITYIANAQSGSISAVKFDDKGAITMFPSDGHLVVTRDSHATQDMALSGNGRFLYVLTAGFDEKLADPRLPTYVKGTPFSGKMSISAYRVEAKGTLTPLYGYGVADDPPTVIGPGVLAPSLGGLAPGSQGIVAT